MHNHIGKEFASIYNFSFNRYYFYFGNGNFACNRIVAPAAGISKGYKLRIPA